MCTRNGHSHRWVRWNWLALAVASLVVVSSTGVASEISGDYLEMRTCDVYTGPCFANAEVGLTGHEAILAWSIERGASGGVDLSGLKVVAVVRASDTLGFGGGLVVNPDPIRSVVLVDENASREQREALVEFVKARCGRLVCDVVRVDAVPIDMTLDHVQMVGSLKAAGLVEVRTRKLTGGDCVCTNEMIFYPPLSDVENSEAAYTVEGRFTGRGLGATWSTPGTRSAFLATFAY